MSKLYCGDMSTQARLTKIQAFEIHRVHRSDIQGAPYNPRRIDKYAQTKLEKNLKKIGLIKPIVVNIQTGNVIDGHQRLSLIDGLEKDADFELDVALVDMTPEQEKAQNIHMNNPTAQGMYDEDQLSELIRTGGFDPSDASFTPTDLALLFDDAELSRLFAVEDRPEPVKEAVAELEEISEMKAAKKAHKAKMNEKDDPGFYVIMVCSSREKADALTEILGDPGAKYLDGDLLLEVLQSE